MVQEHNDLHYNIVLVCKVDFHGSVIAKLSMAHEGMEVVQVLLNNAQGTIVDSLEVLVINIESSNQDFIDPNVKIGVESYGIFVDVPSGKVNLAVAPYLVAFQNETIVDYLLVVLVATSISEDWEKVDDPT